MTQAQKTALEKQDRSGATAAPHTSIRRNVASITRCSLRALPLGEARGVLLAFARRGHDVYVYRPAGPEGLRCVWVQPLAEARAFSHDGCVPLEQWVRDWPALLTEIALCLTEKEAH